MDQNLLIGYITYLLIFFLSTTSPLFIFFKTRLMKEICVLISLVLSIGLINLYFHIGGKMNLGSTAFLGEFYEIFWVIPPIVTYFSCLSLKKGHNN